MTILLAGATGYIGKKLVNKLLGNNYQVLIISRNPSKTSTLFSSESITFFSWDELDIKFDRSLPVDVIVNLAGENIGGKRWSKIQKENLLQSRIEATRKLIDFAKSLKRPPLHWIQASAIGYYGNDPGVEVDENSPKGTGFLSDLVEKWENETEPISSSSTHLHILRLGVVIDKNSEFLAAFLKGKLLKTIICPGNGKNHTSWIHIEDLLMLMLSIVETNKGQIINAVAPNPVKTIDLCVLLKNHFHLKFIVKIPSPLLQAALGTHKTRELILADQRVKSTQSLVNNYKFAYSSFEDVVRKEN